MLEQGVNRRGNVGAGINRRGTFGFCTVHAQELSLL